MSIKKTRVTFNKTNSNLKRARKLYSYLIFEKCIGDREKVVIAAKRARSAGIYSEKTILADVVRSLLGYMKKLDIATNPEFYKWPRNWIQFNFNTECEGYSRHWIK